MLNASFLASNAFVISDVKRPTLSDPNYTVNVSIREYGQLSLSIPTANITAGQASALDDGELGYPLSDYVGNLSGMTITGSFSRFRKSPTSAVSLSFVVSSAEVIP